MPVAPVELRYIGDVDVVGGGTDGGSRRLDPCGDGGGHRSHLDRVLDYYTGSEGIDLITEVCWGGNLCDFDTALETTTRGVCRPSFLADN